MPDFRREAIAGVYGEMATVLPPPTIEDAVPEINEVEYLGPPPELARPNTQPEGDVYFEAPAAAPKKRGRPRKVQALTIT